MESGRSPLYAPLLPPPPAPPPPAPPPPAPPPPPHLLICPTLPNTMHIAPCPNAALYCVSRLDTLSAPPHPTPSSQPVLPRVSGDAKPHFAQNTAPVVPYCVCRQKTRGKSTWGDLTSPAPPHTGEPQLCLLTGPQIVLQYIKRFPIFCFLARHRLVWQDF